MTSNRTDCSAWQNEVDLAFAGELPEADRRMLMTHISECTDCREYHDLVEGIATAAVPEPEESELLAVRRKVIRTIRREETATMPFWSFLPRLAPAAAIGIAVISGALIFAAGLATGRHTNEVVPVPSTAAQNASADVVLARQIGKVAKTNRDLSDVENSPFRYTNVQIADATGDELRVSFDVSRHLDLTLRRDDPLLTEVLVQSVLDPSSVGTQLEAISHAGNVLDPRVLGALIRTMQQDTNLGVRLQAQARLASSAPNRATAEAMLTVLEREPSVQMRLVAIDYLTRSRIDPKRLESAVNAGSADGRTAVYVRARGYIQTF